MTAPSVLGLERPYSKLGVSLVFRPGLVQDLSRTCPGLVPGLVRLLVTICNTTRSSAHKKLSDSFNPSREPRLASLCFPLFFQTKWTTSPGTSPGQVLDKSWTSRGTFVALELVARLFAAVAQSTSRAYPSTAECKRNERAIKRALQQSGTQERSSLYWFSYVAPIEKQIGTQQGNTCIRLLYRASHYTSINDCSNKKAQADA